MPGEQQFSAQSSFSFRSIDPDFFADIIRRGNSITVVVILHSLLRALDVNFSETLNFFNMLDNTGTMVADRS